MGKDLKKTLPNPECELFYPEDKTECEPFYPLDKTAHIPVGQMKTETFGFPE